MKGGGDRVLDWIRSLGNMVFESGVLPEDWRSAVIVPLYKGKGERTECKNYRGISFSVVGKIYAGILVDRVHRMAGGMIDDDWLFNVYMDVVMKEVKMGMARSADSRDYLVSHAQMICFCVASWRRTSGQLWDVLLRYVEEI